MVKPNHLSRTSSSPYSLGWSNALLFAIFKWLSQYRSQVFPFRHHAPNSSLDDVISDANDYQSKQDHIYSSIHENDLNLSQLYYFAVIDALKLVFNPSLPSQNQKLVPMTPSSFSQLKLFTRDFSSLFSAANLCLTTSADICIHQLAPHASAKHAKIYSGSCSPSPKFTSTSSLLIAQHIYWLLTDGLEKARIQSVLEEDHDDINQSGTGRREITSLLNAFSQHFQSLTLLNNVKGPLDHSRLSNSIYNGNANIACSTQLYLFLPALYQLFDETASQHNDIILPLMNLIRATADSDRVKKWRNCLRSSIDEAQRKHYLLYVAMRSQLPNQLVMINEKVPLGKITKAQHFIASIKVVLVAFLQEKEASWRNEQRRKACLTNLQSNTEMSTSTLPIDSPNKVPLKSFGSSSLLINCDELVYPDSYLSIARQEMSSWLSVFDFWPQHYKTNSALANNHLSTAFSNSNFSSCHPSLFPLCPTGCGCHYHFLNDLFHFYESLSSQYSFSGRSLDPSFKTKLQDRDVSQLFVTALELRRLILCCSYSALANKYVVDRLCQGKRISHNKVANQDSNLDTQSLSHNHDNLSSHINHLASKEMLPPEEASPLSKIHSNTFLTSSLDHHNAANHPYFLHYHAHAVRISSSLCSSHYDPPSFIDSPLFSDVRHHETLKMLIPLLVCYLGTGKKYNSGLDQQTMQGHVQQHNQSLSSDSLTPPPIAANASDLNTTVDDLQCGHLPLVDLFPVNQVIISLLQIRNGQALAYSLLLNMPHHSKKFLQLLMDYSLILESMRNHVHNSCSTSYSPNPPKLPINMYKHGPFRKPYHEPNFDALSQSKSGNNSKVSSPFSSYQSVLETWPIPHHMARISDYCNQVDNEPGAAFQKKSQDNARSKDGTGHKMSNEPYLVQEAVHTKSEEQKGVDNLHALAKEKPCSNCLSNSSVSYNHYPETNPSMPTKPNSIPFETSYQISTIHEILDRVYELIWNMLPLVSCQHNDIHWLREQLSQRYLLPELQLFITNYMLGDLLRWTNQWPSMHTLDMHYWRLLFHQSQSVFHKQMEFYQAVKKAEKKDKRQVNRHANIVEKEYDNSDLYSNIDINVPRYDNPVQVPSDCNSQNLDHGLSSTDSVDVSNRCKGPENMHDDLPVSTNRCLEPNSSSTPLTSGNKNISQLEVQLIAFRFRLYQLCQIYTSQTTPSIDSHNELDLPLMMSVDLDESNGQLESMADGSKKLGSSKNFLQSICSIFQAYTILVANFNLALSSFELEAISKVIAVQILPISTLSNSTSLSTQFINNNCQYDCDHSQHNEKKQESSEIYSTRSDLDLCSGSWPNNDTNSSLLTSEEFLTYSIALIGVCYYQPIDVPNFSIIDRSCLDNQQSVEVSSSTRVLLGREKMDDYEKHDHASTRCGLVQHPDNQCDANMHQTINIDDQTHTYQQMTSDHSTTYLNGAMFDFNVMSCFHPNDLTTQLPPTWSIADQSNGSEYRLQRWIGALANTLKLLKSLSSTIVSCQALLSTSASYSMMATNSSTCSSSTSPPDSPRNFSCLKPLIEKLIPGRLQHLIMSQPLRAFSLLHLIALFHHHFDRYGLIVPIVAQVYHFEPSPYLPKNIARSTEVTQAWREQFPLDVIEAAILLTNYDTFNMVKQINSYPIPNHKQDSIMDTDRQSRQSHLNTVHSDIVPINASLQFTSHCSIVPRILERSRSYSLWFDKTVMFVNPLDSKSMGSSLQFQKNQSSQPKSHFAKININFSSPEKDYCIDWLPSCDIWLPWFCMNQLQELRPGAMITKQHLTLLMAQWASPKKRYRNTHGESQSHSLEFTQSLVSRYHLQSNQYSVDDRCSTTKDQTKRNPILGATNNQGDQLYSFLDDHLGLLYYLNDHLSLLGLDLESLSSFFLESFSMARWIESRLMEASLALVRSNWSMLNHTKYDISNGRIVKNQRETNSLLLFINTPAVCTTCAATPISPILLMVIQDYIDHCARGLQSWMTRSQIKQALQMNRYRSYYQWEALTDWWKSRWCWDECLENAQIQVSDKTSTCFCSLTMIHIRKVYQILILNQVLMFNAKIPSGTLICRNVSLNSPILPSRNTLPTNTMTIHGETNQINNMVPPNSTLDCNGKISQNKWMINNSSNLEGIGSNRISDNHYNQLGHLNEDNNSSPIMDYTLSASSLGSMQSSNQSLFLTNTIEANLVKTANNGGNMSSNVECGNFSSMGRVHTKAPMLSKIIAWEPLESKSCSLINEELSIASSNMPDYGSFPSPAPVIPNPIYSFSADDSFNLSGTKTLRHPNIQTVNPSSSFESFDNMVLDSATKKYFDSTHENATSKTSQLGGENDTRTSFFASTIHSNGQTPTSLSTTLSSSNNTPISNYTLSKPTSTKSAINPENTNDVFLMEDLLMWITSDQSLIDMKECCIDSKQKNNDRWINQLGSTVEDDHHNHSVVESTITDFNKPHSAWRNSQLDQLRISHLASGSSLEQLFSYSKRHANTLFKLIYPKFRSLLLDAFPHIFSDINGFLQRTPHFPSILMYPYSKNLTQSLLQEHRMNPMLKGLAQLNGIDGERRAMASTMSQPPLPTSALDTFLNPCRAMNRYVRENIQIRAELWIRSSIYELIHGKGQYQTMEGEKMIKELAPLIHELSHASNPTQYQKPMNSNLKPVHHDLTPSEEIGTASMHSDNDRHTGFTQLEELEFVQIWDWCYLNIHPERIMWITASSLLYKHQSNDEQGADNLDRLSYHHSLSLPITHLTLLLNPLLIFDFDRRILRYQLIFGHIFFIVLRFYMLSSKLFLEERATRSSKFFNSAMDSKIYNLPAAPISTQPSFNNVPMLATTNNTKMAFLSPGNDPYPSHQDIMPNDAIESLLLAQACGIVHCFLDLMTDNFNRDNRCSKQIMSSWMGENKTAFEEIPIYLSADQLKERKVENPVMMSKIMDSKEDVEMQSQPSAFGPIGKSSSNSSSLPIGLSESLCASISSFIHQMFLSNNSLMKLVHIQGYSPSILPWTCKTIPSMHYCLEFLPELLSSCSFNSQHCQSQEPSSLSRHNPLSSLLTPHSAHDEGSNHLSPSCEEMQNNTIFTIKLISQLVQQYPISKALEISHHLFDIYKNLGKSIASEIWLQTINDLSSMVKTFPVLIKPFLDILAIHAGSSTFDANSKALSTHHYALYFSGNEQANPLASAVVLDREKISKTLYDVFLSFLDGNTGVQ